MRIGALAQSANRAMARCAAHARAGRLQSTVILRTVVEAVANALNTLADSVEPAGAAAALQTPGAPDTVNLHASDDVSVGRVSPGDAQQPPHEVSPAMSDELPSRSATGTEGAAASDGPPSGGATETESAAVTGVNLAEPRATTVATALANPSPAAPPRAGDDDDGVDDGDDGAPDSEPARKRANRGHTPSAIVKWTVDVLTGRVQLSPPQASPTITLTANGASFNFASKDEEKSMREGWEAEFRVRAAAIGLVGASTEPVWRLAKVWTRRQLQRDAAESRGSA